MAAKKQARRKRPSKKQRDQVIESAEKQGTNSEDIPFTHHYRPRKLTDFAGQDSVVELLHSIFTTGKVPRAFLIEGPTGSGKTTAARFVSQRVNCLKPKGPNPCGRCASCREYTTYPAPIHPCHVEINASSERGIDTVRELVGNTRYNVIGGNYRVILLDEPQGLTHQAQEALLKPLEDPAGDTIWILSTTDPGKLKSTIIGRCRAGHLKIRPPTTKALAKRLYTICKSEGVKVPKKWLERIAVASNHQPRDAVAVLEQVVQVARARRNVKLEKMLPRIIDEVQSGNPEWIAAEIAADILGDNLTGALEAGKQGIEAHVLLGALVRVWNQVLVYASAPRLVDPFYARMLLKRLGEHEVELDRDELGALVRAGEYLARQYERAKNFVVDPKYLITLTVTGMWDICSEIHSEGEED